MKLDFSADFIIDIFPKSDSRESMSKRGPKPRSYVNIFPDEGWSLFSLSSLTKNEGEQKFTGMKNLR